MPPVWLGSGPKFFKQGLVFLYPHPRGKTTTLPRSICVGIQEIVTETVREYGAAMKFFMNIAQRKFVIMSQEISGVLQVMLMELIVLFLSLNS